MKFRIPMLVVIWMVAVGCDGNGTVAGAEDNDVQDDQTATKLRDVNKDLQTSIDLVERDTSKDLPAADLSDADRDLADTTPPPPHLDRRAAFPTACGYGAEPRD